MTEALITIKGQTPQIISIPEVKPFFDPATGERDYALTRQQARQVLTAWQVTLGEDSGGFVAMPDHFTIVEDGAEPRTWDAIEEEDGATLVYALGQAPLELVVTDTDPAPVRRITDEAALDRLTRLFNREGDSGADFIEYLSDVLTATGRIVRP